MGRPEIAVNSNKQNMFEISEEQRNAIINHLKEGKYEFVAPLINVLSKLNEASSEQKKKGKETKTKE